LPLSKLAEASNALLYPLSPSAARAQLQAVPEAPAGGEQENTSPGAKQMPCSSAVSNKARESKARGTSTQGAKPPAGRFTRVPAEKLI